MEIDINIRNATPEEAQRVLIGMSFAEDILGKISPAIKIEKAAPEEETGYDGDCPNCARNDKCHMDPMPGCFEAKKPAPDPADLEETGCAGCAETGLTDACEKCSPPPAPKKTKAKGPMKPGPHNGNRFGIPSDLYTSDKRLYQRLWARCKKHGIKYEAAMEMEGKTKRGKPAGHAKNPRPATETGDKKPAARLITRYDGDGQDLVDALPEERPPTGPQEKREAEKTMDDIKIGDRVRQIGGLKICTGIGEIKRAVPGSPEVLVAFANGQEWISRRNLAPVMA